jgi:hypothetical protein
LKNDLLVFMKQTIATFFSHVMAAIGGNSAGQGSQFTINMSHMLVFAMNDSKIKLSSAYVFLTGFI